jgi:predicted nuclease with TOPRIM domain
MEKNKKLESEYTQIKVSYADLQKGYEIKSKSINDLSSKLNEKVALVQRLEEDLLRLGGGQQQKSDGIVDALGRNSSSTSNFSAMISSPRTPDGAMTPQQKEDKSILPIVMSQRDRFRQRNAELEERTRSLETSLQDARTEVQNLKADNLKLYERLKFVHVWKEQQQEQGPSLVVSFIYISLSPIFLQILIVNVRTALLHSIWILQNLPLHPHQYEALENHQNHPALMIHPINMANYMKRV